MSNPFQFVLTSRQAGLTGLVQDDGQALPVDMQPLAPPITPLPPLTPQPPTLQGGIIIDPQNATGVATAAGTNTATVRGVTGRVFNQYYNLMKAWDTLFPVFNTALQLVWASSQTDGTDPVVFWGIMLGNHPILIETAGPVQVATGTITLVAARNRSVGSNSPLVVSFSSGAAAQYQLVANTTNSSLAWVYTPSGGEGGGFNMSQPMGLQSPGGTTTPSENNSWASTNTVTLSTLPSVDLVDIRPTFLDYAGNPSQGGMSIYQCLWLSLAEAQRATLGPNVVVRECAINRIINLAGGNNSASNQIWFSNCIFYGGGGLAAAGGSPAIVGGYVDDTADLFQLCSATTAAILDGDFIIGGWTDPGHANTTTPANAGVYFGAVFLDDEVILQGPSKCAAAFYGQGIIYGFDPNTINCLGTMKFAQLQDTFVSTFTAPGLVTGIQLNSSNTGSSHTNANNPDVIHSNISTTPAHLDAATGVAGFGGNAFNLGGASVSNFA